MVVSLVVYPDFSGLDIWVPYSDGSSGFSSLACLACNISLSAFVSSTILSSLLSRSSSTLTPSPLLVPPFPFSLVSCIVYIYWVLAGTGVASAALVFLGAMTFRATPDPRSLVACRLFDGCLRFVCVSAWFLSPPGMRGEAKGKWIYGLYFRAK